MSQTYDADAERDNKASALAHFSGILESLTGSEDEEVSIEYVARRFEDSLDKYDVESEVLRINALDDD